MFACCRAERHRAALAKRLYVQRLQHATAADTRKYILTFVYYKYTREIIFLTSLVDFEVSLL